jgi:endonuclease/exonuclease/phosphatase family metal-dependent hydrolase
MRFLSYNLRNAGIREAESTMALHGWNYRRDAVLDLIAKEDPDVLALQEDNREQLEYIRDAFKDSHRPFFDPALYEADRAYNAIFVRSGLKVAASRAFWISPTQGQQSKIDGSVCFRHATCIRLQQTDPALLVFNVHLDHTDDQTVKQREMEVLIELLGEFAGRPPMRTIMMGDLNSVPTTRAYSLLQEFGLRDSARLQGNEDGTFSCWTEGPPLHRIDYIWLSDDLKNALKSYAVVHGAYRRRDGSRGFPSDHAAVSVQFDF